MIDQNFPTGVDREITVVGKPESVKVKKRKQTKKERKKVEKEEREEGYFPFLSREEEEREGRGEESRNEDITTHTPLLILSFPFSPFLFISSSSHCSLLKVLLVIYSMGRQV